MFKYVYVRTLPHWDKLGPWSSLDEGYREPPLAQVESYVVPLKCQNIGDTLWTMMTKFVWQLVRSGWSSLSTIELNAWTVGTEIVGCTSNQIILSFSVREIELISGFDRFEFSCSARCSIGNRFTCLVKSKPVKQDVILPLRSK